MRMTLKEYLKLPKQKSVKTSKYRNKRSVYNGVEYQSMAEAQYAKHLDVLKVAKKDSDRIVSWTRQVKFPIEVNGKHICNYILDFEVSYADGRKEYVDVKGYQKGVAYSLFTLKKKLVESMYGITIIEHTGKPRRSL